MNRQKHNSLLLALAFLLSPVAAARAQAPFQNLDFESANLSPVPPGQYGGLVSTTNALPAWTGFLGDRQTPLVLQNNLTLGAASIDILGPDWSFGGIIDGQYTLVLQPGAGEFGTNVGASLTQTGLVPTNTLSLQFKAETFSSFSVSLGGQTLSLVPLGTGSDYTLYGANVPSSDIGQVETLTISVSAGPNTADYFDSFDFSTNPIPEPSIWALLFFGAGAFAMARRR